MITAATTSSNGNYHRHNDSLLPVTDYTTACNSVEKYSNTVNSSAIDRRIAEVKSYAIFLHSRTAEGKIIADEITDLLLKLPKMERAAIFFRYGLDLDWPSVAKKLNTSRSSSQRLTSKALMHIRESLSKEEEQEAE